jgi:hypothetical protein
MFLWAVSGGFTVGARWASLFVGGAVFGGAMFAASRCRDGSLARPCLVGVGVSGFSAACILGRSVAGYWAYLVAPVWGLAIAYALTRSYRLGRRSA